MRQAAVGSLDDMVDEDAETQWEKVIDRRTREIDEGTVSCRPVEQAFQGIRTTLSE